MPPRTRPRVQPAGSDKADKVALASLAKNEVPVLYPPIESKTLFSDQNGPSAKEKEVVEKARFLGDYFRFSGYYQVDRDDHGMERYSDRFKRIEGQRGLFDEIVEPSLLLYPPELLEGLSRRPPAIHSQTRFLTSKSLAKSRAADRDDEAEAASMIAGQKGAEGSDNEEEVMAPPEDQEDDDIGGGDYTEMYEDDDENDGGNAFGDDEEACM